MEEKIMRQKIEERNDFDYDERRVICRKSDNKCCHCGKEVYTNYGATVDHFIPLSKGGTNKPYNLVMLCEKCNKTKDNRILYPYNYLDYLHEEDKKKLTDYFESYIQSFEYIGRDNILACDEYIIEVFPQLDYSRFKKKKKPAISTKYALKRARQEDIPKLTMYLYEYLKKHNRLESEDMLSQNIDFWTRFGCIYYIENAEEVKFMTTITIQDFDYSEDYKFEKNNVYNSLYINVFPKYSNDLSICLTRGFMTSIADFICNEQDLKQIPITFAFLDEEKVTAKVLYRLQWKSYHIGGSEEVSTILSPHDVDDTDIKPPREDNDLSHFFGKFRPIKDKVDKWIEENPNMEWMRREVYMRMEAPSEIIKK